MDSPRWLVRLCLVPAASLLLIAGCAKTQSTVGKDAAKPVEEPQLATDATGRIREIQSKVSALEQIADQSGTGASSGSDAAHRQVMEQFFTGLTQVLPLIEGQFQSGEFRQGMRILESSRQQLAAGSTDLAAEPTVDQGLRASLRLLTTLNSSVFGNEAEITKSLDALRRKVDALDTAHGPLNRVVAAQSMHDAVQVLQQMSNILAERAGIDTGPAATPAKAAAAGAGTVPQPALLSNN